MSRAMLMTRPLLRRCCCTDCAGGQNGPGGGGAKAGRGVMGCWSGSGDGCTTVGWFVMLGGLGIVGALVGFTLEIIVAAPGEDFKYPPQLLQKSSVLGLSASQ